MTDWREAAGVILLALFLLAFCLIVSVRAEMGENFPPEHHVWLHQQSNDAGVHCCDPGDCWLVNYRIRAGGYQAFIRGQWMDIPPDKIVRRGNPTGSAVLCISPTNFVWCFFPEAEG